MALSLSNSMLAGECGNRVSVGRLSGKNNGVVAATPVRTSVATTDRLAVKKSNS